MKDFRLFMFDFDGTVADSQGKIWQIVIPTLLAERGFSLLPEDFEFCLNHGPQERVEYFQNVRGFTADQIPTQEERFARIREFYRDSVAYKPGAEEFLRSLREKGLSAVLFSASPTSLLVSGLERLGVERYFDRVFTVDQVGYPKNDPRSYQFCLDAMGATAEETVMFEDSPYSMKTAKEMGITVAAVDEPGMRFQMEEIRKYSDCFLKTMPEFWSLYQ